jgi:DNA-directed RNA polymerase specialized sigma24 family protein
VQERDWLAGRFEESRPHLRKVAYRMLGTGSEADDALQETRLRLSRSDTSGRPRGRRRRRGTTR